MVLQLSRSRRAGHPMRVDRTGLHIGPWDKSLSELLFLQLAALLNVGAEGLHGQPICPLRQTLRTCGMTDRGVSAD